MTLDFTRHHVAPTIFYINTQGSAHALGNQAKRACQAPTAAYNPYGMNKTRRIAYLEGIYR